MATMFHTWLPCLAQPYHITKTMPIADVIKWDAPANVIAWKYPNQELGTWSQLIVAESQEAVMVKEGQFVGPFSAGRHVLSTDNYPILRQLLHIPFGRSPYTAEVWYVQKTYPLDIRWGTATPMLLEDPIYHIILPVRSFGQYGIQVEDSRMFLSKLVGTLPAFTVSTLTQHFRGIILTLVQSAIAAYLVSKGISLLQLSMYQEELSTLLEEKLRCKLALYGVNMTNFSITAINTDERDPAVARLRQAKAQRAEMDIMGYNYQQKRSFDVMETAAGNEGAGGVQASMLGAGIGVGMGMGIGQNMGNQIGQVAQMTQPPLSSCSRCGAQVQPGAKFCITCGAPLQTPQGGTACPQCNSPVSPGARFCSNCGHNL